MQGRQSMSRSLCESRLERQQTQAGLQIIEAPAQRLREMPWEGSKMRGIARALFLDRNIHLVV